MNPIGLALSSGHTAKSILRYLSQHNPKLAQQINSALSAGHSVDNVLRFISKNKNKLGDLISDKQDDKSSNLYKTAQNSLHPSIQGGAKALGTGLAAAGAAYGASQLLPGAALRGQILPALPQARQLAGSPTIQIGHSSVNLPPNPTPTNPNPSAPPNGSPVNPQSAGNIPATQNINSPTPTTQTTGVTQADNSISHPSFPPNVPNSLPQPVNNQQLPENNLEALTDQDKAFRSIQDRQKESSRLFELAKEKRPGKEGTTPFMRIARDLVKKGHISNEQEFDEFRKYWTATEGEKRGNPLVEFETFRSKRPQYQEDYSSKPLDPDKKYPRQFFKGKDRSSIDTFANDRLQDAFKEIENGIAAGEDYGVFHGDEWQAVGHKNVNEGAPNSPNEPKRNIQPGKKLIQVIQDHVPIQGLYHYYFDTAEKRKRMPFSKFSRGYEKVVEEMIVKKTNPKMYEKQQEKESEFLNALKNDGEVDQSMIPEVIEEIENLLFNHYDEEFENYLQKMIKSIR